MIYGDDGLSIFPGFRYTGLSYQLMVSLFIGSGYGRMGRFRRWYWFELVSFFSLFHLRNSCRRRALVIGGLDIYKVEDLVMKGGGSASEEASEKWMEDL